MASPRPPKTYSPSFRTGRRSEGVWWRGRHGPVPGLRRMAGVSALIDAHVPRGLLRLGRGRTVVPGSHTSRIDTRALDLHGRFDAAGGSGPEVPAARAGPTPRAAGIVRQLPRVRGRTPGLPRGASACDGGSRARPGGAIAAPGRARREVVLDEAAAAVATDGTQPRFRRRRATCQLVVRRRAQTTSNNSSASVIAPITGGASGPRRSSRPGRRAPDRGGRGCRRTRRNQGGLTPKSRRTMAAEVLRRCRAMRVEPPAPGRGRLARARESGCGEAEGCPDELVRSCQVR